MLQLKLTLSNQSQRESTLDMVHEILRPSPSYIAFQIASGPSTFNYLLMFI